MLFVDQGRQDRYLCIYEDLMEFKRVHMAVVVECFFSENHVYFLIRYCFFLYIVSISHKSHTNHMFKDLF